MEKNSLNMKFMSKIFIVHDLHQIERGRQRWIFWIDTDFDFDNLNWSRFDGIVTIHIPTFRQSNRHLSIRFIDIDLRELWKYVGCEWKSLDIAYMIVVCMYSLLAMSSRAYWIVEIVINFHPSLLVIPSFQPLNISH